jgi:hypothetical protein
VFTIGFECFLKIIVGLVNLCSGVVGVLYLLCFVIVVVGIVWLFEWGFLLGRFESWLAVPVVPLLEGL